MEEKVDTDEEEDRGTENYAPALNYTLGSQVSGIVSHSTEEEMLPYLNFTRHSSLEKDSMEQDATSQSVMQLLLPKSDADSADSEQEADGITDEGENKKGGDGSDGDDLNYTDKFTSHAREASGLTSLGKDNKDMTGSDPKGTGTSSSSSSSEGSSVGKWTLPKFNVTGIGLYVPMPPEFLRHLLSPMFPASRSATTSSPQTER